MRGRMMLLGMVICVLCGAMLMAADGPRVVGPNDSELTDKVVIDATDWLAGSANAKADERAIEDLRKAIVVDYDGRGVGTALSLWAQSTGVNLVVNWKTLEGAGIDRDTLVTLHLPQQAPAYKVLDHILKQVGGGLGWNLDSGILTVSTREDLESARFQLVLVYDVRDLLRSAIASRRSDITYDDAAKELIDSIKSVVVVESWRDNGGTIGSIRELNGQLIINQTSDGHRKIARLLDTLRTGRPMNGTQVISAPGDSRRNLNQMAGRMYEPGK